MRRTGVERDDGCKVEHAQDGGAEDDEDDSVDRDLVAGELGKQSSVGESVVAGEREDGAAAGLH